MTRLLLFWYCLCDRNQYVYRQKSDAILVVCGEVLEERDHLFNDYGWRHGFDEFGEVVCCLSSDHGGIIVDQLAIMLSKGFLGWRCGSGVGSLVQTSRGDLGGKPVGFGEAQD